MTELLPFANPSHHAGMCALGLRQLVSMGATNCYLEEDKSLESEGIHSAQHCLLLSNTSWFFLWEFGMSGLWAPPGQMHSRAQSARPRPRPPGTCGFGCCRSAREAICVCVCACVSVCVCVCVCVCVWCILCGVRVCMCVGV